MKSKQCIRLNGIISHIQIVSNNRSNIKHSKFSREECPPSCAMFASKESFLCFICDFQSPTMELLERRIFLTFDSQSEHTCTIVDSIEPNTFELNKQKKVFVRISTYSFDECELRIFRLFLYRLHAQRSNFTFSSIVAAAIQNALALFRCSSKEGREKKNEHTHPQKMKTKRIERTM